MAEAELIFPGQYGVEELPQILPPPKVGMIIRNHLFEIKRDYISNIHIHYKSLYRGYKTTAGKVTKLCTYNSFAMYVHGLIIAGLLKATRSRQRTTNPKAYNLGYPKVTFVELTSKGKRAPDYVWEHPLRLWYRPYQWEYERYSEYISTEAVVQEIRPPKPRKLRKVRPVKVIRRPKVELTPEVPKVPKKRGKPKIEKEIIEKEIVVSALSLAVDRFIKKYKSLINYTMARNELADLSGKFDLDTSDCLSLLVRYRNLTRRDFPSREDFELGKKAAWGKFLDCVEGLKGKAGKEVPKRAKIKVVAEGEKPKDALDSFIKRYSVARNYPGAKRDLTKLGELYSYDINECLELLEEYHELDREEFDTQEEFEEGKEQGWEDFIDYVRELSEGSEES